MFCEELLRNIVHKLAIDENINLVVYNFLALLFNSISLGLFDFFHLGVRVNLHTASIYFDAINVESRVSNQDLGIFNSLWLAGTYFLV